MTAPHFTRLWMVVGLALVFYSVNSWIAGQGGKPILDLDLVDERPVTSALIALPICSVLLTLLCRIGLGFAAKSTNARAWHERMPLIGLDGVDTSSREGRLYQGFFLFLFIGVPSASLVYFTQQVLSANVYDSASSGKLLAPLDPVPVGTMLTRAYWDNRFRLGENASEAATWFPVLEPLVFALLLAMTGWHVARLSYDLFVRQP